MAVNDLIDVLGSLTKDGLVVQEGDRLRLTEAGLRRAGELYLLLPPDA